MKTNKPLTLLIVTVVISSVFSSSLQARERSGSRSARNGAASSNYSVSAASGSQSRSSNWNTQRGNGSRIANNSWDKSTGTGTHESTSTYANGKTTASSKVVTKTDSGFIKSGTVSGPNGQEVTGNKSVDYSKNEDGSVTRTTTKSATGPNGETVGGSNTQTYHQIETAEPSEESVD